MYKAPKILSFVMAAGRSLELKFMTRLTRYTRFLVLLDIIIKRPHKRAQHNVTFYN